MRDPIYFRNNDQWVAASRAPFVNEAELRDLIAALPALIPGVVEPACALIEVPLRGAALNSRVDVLIVDSSAQVVIVECKLSSNSDLRRNAVAQLLAPAATLRGARAEDLDRHCRLHSRDSRGFSDVLFPGGGADLEEFMARIDDTLAAEALRLVLVCDRLDQDAGAHELIEYLQPHLASSALAMEIVEIAKVTALGTEVVVPFLTNWAVAGGAGAIPPALASAQVDAAEDMYEVLASTVPKQLVLRAREDDEAIRVLWPILFPDARTREALASFLRALFVVLEARGTERVNWCINLLPYGRIRVNLGPVEVFFVDPTEDWVAVGSTTPIDDDLVYNAPSPFNALVRISATACRAGVPVSALARLQPRLLDELSKIADALEGRKLSGNYASGHAAALVRMLESGGDQV